MSQYNVVVVVVVIHHAGYKVKYISLPAESESASGEGASPPANSKYVSAEDLWSIFHHLITDSILYSKTGRQCED